MSELAPRRSLGLAPGVPDEATGQDAKKYGTTNPVVARLIARWLAAVREAVGTEPGLVVDVGTGEGLAAERTLPVGLPFVGVEYRSGKVVTASRRLPNLRGVVGDA